MKSIIDGIEYSRALSRFTDGHLPGAKGRTL
jgi:hypothetical protein